MSSILMRDLPEALRDLPELALDLRWAGTQPASKLWEALDPETWQRTRNPWTILQSVPQSRLEEAARDPHLLDFLRICQEGRKRHEAQPAWFPTHHAKSPLTGVAYFSMEFLLSEALPIYSGGLGNVAGDQLKSASDLGVPVHAIGLLYQQGYFRQVIAEDGQQLEALPYNDPSHLPITPVRGPEGQLLLLKLEFPGRKLRLRVWQARVGRATLYLLDSNDPLNNPWDRGITANLYAAGKDKRLLQEIVLGVGGWRLLEQLGIEVEVCHLNEGHAAFAVMARASSFAEKHNVPFRVALRATRAGNVFTTHTPVEAAFDRFEPSLLARYSSQIIEKTGLTMDEFLGLGRVNPKDASEPFNMAFLALHGCGVVNGVARLHGRVSRKLFQMHFPSWAESDVPIGHVTNGVHVPTWASVPARHLWSHHAGPGWADHVEGAAPKLAAAPALELWNFRGSCRQALIAYVRARLANQIAEHGGAEEWIQRARHVLDPNALTLGFARRFTEYKRPNLLLHDAERLAHLLKDPDRPVQLIVAGKAHPNDGHGKSLVQAMAQFARRPDLFDHVVFLEDYDMALAQHLAAGIDVWINAPRRPAEACGTSGMKMLVNGVLNFSIRDGWWDEAYAPEVGWSFGTDRDYSPAEGDTPDANDLYDRLERDIVPEFYRRDSEGIPQQWVQRVRASMMQLTAPFSSHRAVQDYVTKAYLPAAQAYRKRIKDGAKLAVELENWRHQLEECWHGVRICETRITPIEDRWAFEVRVYLGDLSPKMVNVELFAEPLSVDDGGCRIAMDLTMPIAGAVNGHIYTAEVPGNRPAEHYTPRLVPFHVDAFVPLEDQHILWRA